MRRELISRISHGRRVVAALLIVLGCVAAVGFSGVVGVHANVITLGHVSHLANDPMLHYGIAAAIQEVNNAGGIGGGGLTTVSLAALDDQGNATLAAAHAETLISGGAIAILAPKDYDCCVAVFDVCAAAQVLLAAPATRLTAKIRTPFSPYVVTLRPSIKDEVYALMDMAVSSAYRVRLGFFYSYDKVGLEALDHFRAAVRALNAGNIGSFSYTPLRTDRSNTAEMYASVLAAAERAAALDSTNDRVNAFILAVTDAEAAAAFMANVSYFQWKTRTDAEARGERVWEPVGHSVLEPVVTLGRDTMFGTTLLPAGTNMGDDAFYITTIDATLLETAVAASPLPNVMWRAALPLPPVTKVDSPARIRFNAAVAAYLTAQGQAASIPAALISGDAFEGYVAARYMLAVLNQKSVATTAAGVVQAVADSAMTRVDELAYGITGPACDPENPALYCGVSCAATIVHLIESNGGAAFTESARFPQFTLPPESGVCGASTSTLTSNRAPITIGHFFPARYADEANRFARGFTTYLENAGDMGGRAPVRLCSALVDSAADIADAVQGCVFPISLFVGAMDVNPRANASITVAAEGEFWTGEMRSGSATAFDVAVMEFFAPFDPVLRAASTPFNEAEFHLLPESRVQITRLLTAARARFPAAPWVAACLLADAVCHDLLDLAGRAAAFLGGKITLLKLASLSDLTGADSQVPDGAAFLWLRAPLSGSADVPSSDFVVPINQTTLRNDASLVELSDQIDPAAVAARAETAYYLSEAASAAITLASWVTGGGASGCLLLPFVAHVALHPHLHRARLDNVTNIIAANAFGDIFDSEHIAGSAYTVLASSFPTVGLQRGDMASYIFSGNATQTPPAATDPLSAFGYVVAMTLSQSFSMLSNQHYVAPSAFRRDVFKAGSVTANAITIGTFRNATGDCAPGDTGLTCSTNRGNLHGDVTWVNGSVLPAAATTMPAAMLAPEMDLSLPPAPKSVVGPAVGGAVGGAALLAICSGLAYWRWKRSQRDNSRAPRDQKKPVAVIFTDIESSTRLWATDPERMEHCLSLHHALARELVEQHGLYEVKTVGDSFMIAGDSIDSAVAFTVDFQRRLLEVDYGTDFMDREVYAAETSSDEEGSSADDADLVAKPTATAVNGTCAVVVTAGETQGLVTPGSPATAVDSSTKKQKKNTHRGLRVRIGLAFDLVTVRLDAVTKGYDYYGEAVNSAARIEAAAFGGQILLPTSILSQLSQGFLDRIEAVPRDVGVYTLRGNLLPTPLTQLLPGSVALRTFPSAVRLEHVESADVVPDEHTRLAAEVLQGARHASFRSGKKGDPSYPTESQSTADESDTRPTSMGGGSAARRSASENRPNSAAGTAAATTTDSSGPSTSREIGTGAMPELEFIASRIRAVEKKKVTLGSAVGALHLLDVALQTLLKPMRPAARDATLGSIAAAWRCRNTRLSALIERIALTKEFGSALKIAMLAQPRRESQVQAGRLRTPHAPGGQLGALDAAAGSTSTSNSHRPSVLVASSTNATVQLFVPQRLGTGGDSLHSSAFGMTSPLAGGALPGGSRSGIAGAPGSTGGVAAAARTYGSASGGDFRATWSNPRSGTLGPHGGANPNPLGGGEMEGSANGNALRPTPVLAFSRDASITSASLSVNVAPAPATAVGGASSSGADMGAQPSQSVSTSLRGSVTAFTPSGAAAAAAATFASHLAQGSGCASPVGASRQRTFPPPPGVAAGVVASFTFSEDENAILTAAAAAHAGDAPLMTIFPQVPEPQHSPARSPPV